MGITVIPKERDEATDLSRLEIKFDRGEVESPSRFITKVDINAKDGIGADIPLSRTRKLFMYEEFINPNTIDNILNRNGYLATFITNFQNFLLRVERSDALRLVYPKFTKAGLDALRSLGESNRNKVWEFIFEAIHELSYGKAAIDGFYIQYDHLTEAGRSYALTQSLQFVPVIDIHGDIKVVTKQMNEYVDMSSSLVPFIGLTYSTKTRSNLAYNQAISILDSLHEAGKGFITVGSPRTSGRWSEDPDVSAIHYSSFIVADLTAERTYGGGSSGEPNLRLFEKGDLAVPPLGHIHSSTEHSDEISTLNGDRRLQELLGRMISGAGNLSEADKRRAPYLSRVHENLVTGCEYENMRRSIIDNELLRYRAEKRRLNQMLLVEGR